MSQYESASEHLPSHKINKRIVVLTVQYYNENQSLHYLLKFHVWLACQNWAIFTSVSQNVANHFHVQFCLIFLILTKICMKVFTDTTREIFWTQKAFLCQQNISKLLFYIYSFNYSSLSCQTHNYFHINTCCISHVCVCLFYLFNLHH